MDLPTDKIEVNESINEEGGRTTLNLVDIANDAKELKEILLKETELLRKQKIKEVGELNEEKVRLIRKLEIAKEIVSKKPEMLEGDESSMSLMIGITSNMDDVMQKNYDEVLKAREVNKRVVEAVFYAAMEDKRGSLGYDKAGTSNASVTSGKEAAPSIAFNKSI